MLYKFLNFFSPPKGPFSRAVAETGAGVKYAGNRPHYTLHELLDGSDYSEPQTPEEREWVGSPAVGREII